jgi:hypothetical protein
MTIAKQWLVRAIEWTFFITLAVTLAVVALSFR